MISEALCMNRKPIFIVVNEGSGKRIVLHTQIEYVTTCQASSISLQAFSISLCDVGVGLRARRAANAGQFGGWRRGGPWACLPDRWLPTARPRRQQRKHP